MTDDLGLLIDLSHLISFPVEPTATNNVWGDSLDPLLDRSGSDGQSACVKSSQQKKASLEDLFLSSLRLSSSSSTKLHQRV